MTRIEFIFNVENKWAKVAELCEKAVAKGRQLTISSENSAEFATLQQKLWQASESSFLPMYFLENAMEDMLLAKYCPIHFSLYHQQSQHQYLIQDDVLMHFHAETPPFFSRFRYLVELVGVEEQEKVSARMRYKFYRDRGYQIKTTNMADN